MTSSTQDPTGGGAGAAERVGPFTIQGTIARGGVGDVLVALDVRGERVAIKRARGGDVLGASLLRREIAVLTRLTGVASGTVSMLQHRAEDEPPWYAMKLVRGVSLSSWCAPEVLATEVSIEANPGEPATEPLRFDSELSEPNADRVSQGPSPECSSVNVMSVCRSLAETVALLHELGVVHCDISPANILIDDHANPVLLDFSSSCFDDFAGGGRETARDGLPAYVTRGYVAPEVCNGLPGDARSDVYSLGRVFRALLSAIADSNLPELEVLRRTTHAMLRTDPARRPRTGRAVCRMLASGPSNNVEPVRPIYRSPLVGRSEIVRTMRLKIAEAIDGRGGAVALRGGAGIGKTRLLNHIMSLASASGARVVLGACPSPGTRLSSSAGFSIVDALRGWHEERPGSAADLVDITGSRAKALDHLWAQFERLAVETPVVLCLEDLHWGDDLTLAFVKSERLSGLRRLRGLLVITYRDDEADLSASKMPEPEIWTEFHVPLLTGPDLRDAALGLLGSTTLPPGLESWLQVVTEGNPLYLTEILRALVETGRLRAQGDGERWILAAPLPSPTERHSWVPRSLPAVVEERLGTLPASAREVARVATYLGKEFTTEELSAVYEAIWPLAEDRCARGLDALLEGNVLRRTPLEDLTFVHACFRDASVWLDVGLADELLSLRLAEYYSETQDQEKNRVAASLAQLGSLWARARRYERAGLLLLAAAQRFSLQRESTRARVAYASAFDAFSGCASDVLASHVDLLIQGRIGFAEVLYQSGEYEESLLNCEMARCLLGEGHALLRAETLRKAGRAAQGAKDYERAKSLLDEAQRVIEATPRDSTEWWNEWFEVRQAQFWAAYYSGTSTREVLESLEHDIHVRGDARQRCEFYWCATAAGSIEDGHRGTARVLSFARTAAAVMMHVPALEEKRALGALMLGFPLLWSEVPEQWTEALARLLEAERFAVWLDDVSLLARARTYLSFAYRRCGDVASAESMSRIAMATADRSGSPGYIGATAANLAWVAWCHGDFAEAQVRIADARDAWQDGRLRFPFQCMLNFVWLDVLRGREEFARACEVASELLAPDLHRLPEPLGDTIRGLKGRSFADPRDWDRALVSVVDAARSYGYA